MYAMALSGRRAPRHRDTAQLHARVGVDVADRLAEAALKRNVSVSLLVEELLDQALSR
jgi:predicted HicB family RNase H-like nuclease